MRRNAPRHVQPTQPDSDPVRRARRLVNKGEARRALVLLRNACSLNEHDARIWAFYGLACHHAGRVADAEQALSHSVWVRHHARQYKRAAALRQWMFRMGLASTA